jgi:hypothetical protein
MGVFGLFFLFLLFLKKVKFICTVEDDNTTSQNFKQLQGQSDLSLPAKWSVSKRDLRKKKYVLFTHFTVHRMQKHLIK